MSTMVSLMLTPANPAQPNGLARLETLPTDIILKICNYLPGWKDVLDLLKVSTILYSLHAQREIWSLLVSRSLNALDALRICYLDHPIYCYSAEELRRTFMRWKMAENAWTDRQISRELRSTELSAPAHRNISVNRPKDLPYETQGRSILAPGGRWLIVLTDTVSAVYYDLDSIVDAPAPEPYILFIPQSLLRSATGPAQISMSLPDADPGSPLKFRFAVTFATPMPEDSAPSCILQIWEVTTVIDVEVNPHPRSRQTRLSSTLLVSISFLPELSEGLISVKALAGNNVVIDIPKLRPGPVTTCLSIIDWTTSRLKEDRFRRRVILFSDTIHSAMPVGTHNLLLTSPKGIFLYNYRRTPVIRTFASKGFENLVDPEHSMFCNFIAHGEFHFVSAPVITRTPNGAVSQNVACCNSTGEMYLVSISPRAPGLSHSYGRTSLHSTGDLESDQVENWYLGNSPARKAFKKTLASTTTMCLGANQGVILERTIRKSGGMNMQLSIVCYEREALDQLARSVNDDPQEFALGGGPYGDYVIGQVISRDIPLDFGRLSRPSRHGDNQDPPSPAVLFFDESIARVVLHTHGRLHVVDL